MIMLNKTENPIFTDSPMAAEPITITAWKSATGRVFFDQSTARYDGATHARCIDCGVVMEKRYTICPACRDKRDKVKYDAMPKQEWDGKAMVYSDTKDKFYTTPEEAEDCLEEGQTLSDLRLIICTPVFASEIESDFFEDELPSDCDGDLPGWLEDAMDAFNTAIREGGPLSWEPGKIALKVEDNNA